MIVVDTSALVAIAFAEPEREAFLQAIKTAGKALVSTVSVVETRMVVHGRRGQRAVILVDDLLRLPMFELVAPGQTEADAAYVAFARLGSGLAFRNEIPYAPPMSRPLRIEFPGAVYHVTSRGDRREPIYRDDEDRVAQLEVIALAMDRFDAQVLAYCQMGHGGSGHGGQVLPFAPHSATIPACPAPSESSFPAPSTTSPRVAIGVSRSIATTRTGPRTWESSPRRWTGSMLRSWPIARWEITITWCCTRARPICRV